MLENVITLEVLWEYVNPKGQRSKEDVSISDIYRIAKIDIAKVFAKSLYKMWEVVATINEDVMVIEAQECDSMSSDYYVCDLRTGYLTKIQ